MWHHTLIFIKDPIGSSPPNIPIKEKFSHMGSMEGNTLAMSCPAQGFPVPAFRYSKPCPNFNCSLSHTNSEPVGSSAPKTSIKLDSIRSSDKHALSMSCPAQGFPLPAFRWFFSWVFENVGQFLDPIGSSSPNVPAKDKLGSMSSKMGQSLSMSCPAQAFPLPAFRYSLSSETSHTLPIQLSQSP